MQLKVPHTEHKTQTQSQIQLSEERSSRNSKEEEGRQLFIESNEGVVFQNPFQQRMTFWTFVYFTVTS